MSERVELNLEKMMNELNDYLKRGIFDKEEIKTIVTTRKRHEYKLNRPEKQLIDFLRYIEYETILEKIKDKRMTKLNINVSSNDNTLFKHILYLYKSALIHFGEDKKLFIQFLRYLTKKRCLDKIKTVMSEHCARYPLDADLWIFCAEKYFAMNDIENCRKLYQQAISLNKKCFKLKIEFFKSELKYVNSLIETDEENGISYQEAVTLQNYEILISIYRELSNLKPTKEIIDELMDMIENNPILTNKISQIKSIEIAI
ncbi:U3 small nucleolar RNA-associated protein 6 [Hamiltosporidium magnivora]|uniref:U3 small nucleolar RNA-associated protein 6 n=1 Tax=Hamiltosporidium magnivora TaxID=148818 RepID=A0A4Q9LFF6_9MICR|nr:U3 small nucleolar RNA-associated protein 6 [Hamiltosporidium magnivora]